MRYKSRFRKTPDRLDPQQLYLDFLRRERPDLPLIIEHAPVDQIPEVLQKVLVATAARA
jgi:hypothetical protein